LRWTLSTISFLSVEKWVFAVDQFWWRKI
jgi:hypothetical protein